MLTSEEAAADVLVVGLGPVGATLTALLVRRGVRVLAIDKEADVYPLPRAVGFDHEIWRIFQQAGVAEQVMPHVRESRFYDFLGSDGRLVLRYDRANMKRTSGWPPNVTFFQPAVEDALRAAVRASGRGEIRTSRRLVTLQDGPEGVTARLDSPEGEEVVKCRFLVGCDGASSVVRSLIGTTLADDGFDEPWLVIDCLASDETGLPDRNLQFCDPARPATFMRMGPGRHRWEFMLLPGEVPEAMRETDTIRRLIEARGFPVPHTIERRAVYRFHALMADRWRSGNILLAGDSAHQTPPFAGQGMCSGLRDAANLAWKLAFVLNDKADDALLDSYQTEREPQLRFIIDLAAKLGRIVCTTHRSIAAERDEQMRADLQAGKQALPMAYPPLSGGCVLAGTAGAGSLFPQPVAETSAGVSRLDDVFAGRTILLSRTSPISAKRAVGLAQFELTTPELSPFAAELTAWLDAHGAPAVLIRPDLYVFGTGTPEHLADRWCEALHPSMRSLLTA
ncbi:bifunctional 3-(3-hydroxy-phenyl)propionate/3-hydroxycinnamic acid hydroxylase [Bradyrhizobium sp. GCM10027634]|uniref:bifunctional 3-(3-hydroxy-phenyl)propionate/3-hydroxycinnamic acid hydroxylase MhpA n=1 Tax=unclassified Bradyrhizobium TaxID=2631580 RepID=UPI00188C8774|nr:MULTISPECIES: bifunctional 3-(3-hydroxy-phenyl)propionate/3-hydroxycinnamic acid hydroxylase [unclassified Bradyrhizobium]MDN5005606.1 bifunctional 3-(3-hydroxy-phenyl)propionate/3-hydroxycinnamic acid hydroxylase [Bradyrhizobium sp. WYCCWR 12677]QOZ44603.1 monooxygenase [Bradyrhizobium sp. CCBAU 53340]